MRGKKTTDRQRMLVFLLLRNGLTKIETAARLGIGYTTVRNLTKGDSMAKPTPVPDDFERQVIDMYTGRITGIKHTRDDVARYFHKSDLVIRDILDRNNIPKHSTAERIAIDVPINEDDIAKLYNKLHFGRKANDNANARKVRS